MIRASGRQAPMKQAYPNFDLRTEVQNQEFLALLRANIPMQHAYEVLHRDEGKRLECDTAPLR